MFALIIPSRPVNPSPTLISPTQFAFSFPTHTPFSHIIPFILPGNSLPPGTAAAVYLKLPEDQDFRFLGALADEKPSAIFQVKVPGSGMQAEGTEEGQLGISIEPLETVRQLLEGLPPPPASSSSINGTGAGSWQGQALTTKTLAQRIIKHAFNFVSSFSGRVGEGGVEVVPLKAFEEWWKKFERRVEVDAGFLEREGVGD